MTDTTSDLVAALERVDKLSRSQRISFQDAADLRLLLAALARAKAEDVQAASERSLWQAHDRRLAALQEPGHG